MNETPTPPPAPSAPKYRNLDAGDTAQPGDEYLECGQWRKIPAHAFRPGADPFDFNSYAIRRPLQPSASHTQLREFCTKEASESAARQRVIDAIVRECHKSCGAGESISAILAIIADGKEGK
jgi:hypothetical protein